MTDSEIWDDAVIVALGSNLGDSRALLEAALVRFPRHGLTVKARSRWWRSAAWPDPARPPFLNGVALIETTHSPAETLAALLEIETGMGRVRHAPNAPRTLDLDLIAHGRLRVASICLTLPHPRAHERRFVMGPLAEIAAPWRHPVSGLSAATLAATASIGADAVPD